LPNYRALLALQAKGRVMDSMNLQDMNLDIIALEEFATYLAANAEKASSFAPFTAHDSNNDSAV
jgi:hypothetical protein